MADRKKYVYTGPGAYLTEDGVRTNIEEGGEFGVPFMASERWMARRHMLKHRFPLYDDWFKEKNGVQKDFDAPGADMKKEDKPKPKRKRKAKKAE